MNSLIRTAVVLLVVLSACTRTPLREREDSLRKISGAPQLSDDLPVEPLLQALETEIKFLRGSTRVRDFKFGRDVFTKDEYIRGLQKLLDVSHAATAQGADAKAALLKTLRADFDFYEVYGGDDWGEVFMTSYYEPLLRASKTSNGPHTRALYRMPDDLVEIPLGKFNGFAGNSRTLTGRLSAKLSSRGYVQVMPYYTREEIDAGNALASKKLEIVYVDPIEAFFLQIQGSGTVELPDGRKLRLGYAGQNGHPYEAVGKFLKDVIPIEKITAHTIEDYLRTLPPARMQSYLNNNPSYVFFKELDSDPITYMGTPVVAGRTIATDTKFFPKGALAFLTFEKPVFANAQATEPTRFEPTARLVMDQDRGGAINGGGRLDLFWGSGPEAKQASGVVKGQGRLYYLAPKRAR